jgi:hypothetical protein
LENEKLKTRLTRETRADEVPEPVAEVRKKRGVSPFDAPRC